MAASMGRTELHYLQTNVEDDERFAVGI